MFDECVILALIVGYVVGAVTTGPLMLFFMWWSDRGR